VTDIHKANFHARFDPELGYIRLRLTRLAISVFFTLLAAWLLTDILFFVSPLKSEGHNFGFDMLVILISALVGGLALTLANRGHGPIAGYILGCLIFALAFASTLIYPEAIFQASAGFLIAVTVIGATVGGVAGYPIAGLSFLAVAAGWLRARSVFTGKVNPFSEINGVLFVSSQAALYFGAATLLHSFSRHIQNTIEKLNSQREQLTELAHTDPLTGLANRRHLFDQLNREFTRARRYRRPLSLIYLDLDGFKSINDRFGHIFGDEILRGAALAMRAVLRSTDLLARIGGDEFAVLLPETSLEGAQRVSNKLRKALIAYSRRHGPWIPSLTFCAGIGQLRNDDQSIDDLLARSDEAQYRAKDAGEGQTRTQREFDQLPLFESHQDAKPHT
jgi:diguanylate cyclase (GGDEF)-like protein